MPDIRIGVMLHIRARTLYVSELLAIVMSVPTL